MTSRVIHLDEIRRTRGRPNVGAAVDPDAAYAYSGMMELENVPFTPFPSTALFL